MHIFESSNIILLEENLRENIRCLVVSKIRKQKEIK